MVVNPLPTAGANMKLSLPMYYYGGVFMTLIGGLLPLMQSTMMFCNNFTQLPPVLKPYIQTLAWNWFLVANYLLRDAYTVYVGGLENGLWCKAQGIINIGGILALRMSAAVTAYAVCRLANGKPLPSRQLYAAHAFSWVVGAALAALWIVHDSYGIYKGLYCCLKETAYEPRCTGPCFLVTFSSICMSLYYYHKANRAMSGHKTDDPRTAIIVKRALIHGLSFYVFWSGIIGAGTVTALGGHVPVAVDMVAAWIVKFEVSVDSWLLMDTLEMVMDPKKQPVWMVVGGQ